MAEKNPFSSKFSGYCGGKEVRLEGDVERGLRLRGTRRSSGEG